MKNMKISYILLLFSVSFSYDSNKNIILNFPYDPILLNDKIRLLTEIKFVNMNYLDRLHFLKVNQDNTPNEMPFKSAFLPEFLSAAFFSIAGGLGLGLAGMKIGDKFRKECLIREREQDDDSGCGQFCCPQDVVGFLYGAGIGYVLGSPFGVHISGQYFDRKGSVLLSFLFSITGTAAMYYTAKSLYDKYDENSLKFTIPLLTITPWIMSVLGYEIVNL